MDPFCDNLESFVNSYGDDGKAELNSLCSQRQLELAPQGEDTKFTYGGLQIKDGLLRLVFADGNPGGQCLRLQSGFSQRDQGRVLYRLQHPGPALREQGFLSTD